VALARYTQQYHRTTVLPHYGNTRKIYPNIMFYFILSFSVFPEAASPKELPVSTPQPHFQSIAVSYFIIILPHAHTHTHTHTHTQISVSVGILYNRVSYKIRLHGEEFLTTFTEMRRATISFAMSVYLSASKTQFQLDGFT
jgi:hypothetical protein